MKKTNSSNQEPEKKTRARRHNEPVINRILSWFVPKRGKKLRTNRYMFHTSLLVVLLFLALIGYIVKFTINDAPDIITSPYNKRTTALSERILRGSIKSANDKVLAESSEDEDGDVHREYPYEEMFAHVVGYATHGKAGLESAFNYELLTSHVDLMTQLQNGISGKKSTGDTLVTTLDTRLQKAAYYALEDYRGAIVAIEPKTGKVRAMVSKPDFDPNELDDIWEEINSDEDNSCLLNRCTQGLYPPGSTYKLLTALEYMEENKNSYEDFEYECTGDTIVDSVHISCYEDEVHGTVDLDTAFAESCNTAFVTLGSTLNLKKFAELNEKCLFDQRIPFDLSVKKSRFDLDERSEKIEVPQTVIGQGNTLMTPFHNALLMCATANDGVLMKPYLVEKIESADGVTVKETESEEYKTLMNAEDAKKLQKMLRDVVTDGTGHALDTDEYTVAGKTGTAENEKEKAHSWFFGYSNVDDPDLVVCVVVENTGAGSKYAAPIAKQIFDSYYNNEMDELYR